MGRKKFLNEYSAEELLKISEEGESKENPSGSSMLSFLHYFEIKPGEFPVKKAFLYKLYKLWCKTEPERRYDFGIFINLYFKTNHSYVFIDKEQFKLTDSAYKKMTFRPTLTREKRYHHMVVQNLLSFLKAKKIQQGKGYISRIGLYYIYEKWCLDNRKQIMAPKTFAELLNKYFKLMRSRRYGWGIRYDDTTALINKEEKIAAMIWGKKYRKSHGNRKNKKEEI